MVALLAATALELTYLTWRPATPDLAAQMARASAASRGAGVWWAGWYGGINTAPYSAVGAAAMDAFGVTAIGLVATALICLGGAELMRQTARPRAGSLAIAVAACANLYSGRITFSGGMALCVLSFCLIQRGHSRAAAFPALMTGLVSPLATLVYVMGLAGLAETHRRRWRPHLALGLVALSPVLVIAVLLGQPARMPFTPTACGLTLMVCAAVTFAKVPSTVRALSLIAGFVAVAAFIVPSPVGNNASRMPMLLAAPLVVATARTGTWRTWVLVGALSAWPVANLGSELAVAGHPSSNAMFYQPLLDHLPAAGTSLQRIEVLDPRTHGAAYFVSRRMTLARGWERQTDVAQNPGFYDGSLTSESYRAWLDAHAVGLVAVPHVQLDQGGRAEAELIATALPYLRDAWSDDRWTLYAVASPAPIATGILHAARVTDTSVGLQATGPGTGLVRLAYSRLLAVRSLQSPAVYGCIQEQAPGLLRITVPASGPYVVKAEFGALLRPCS